MPNPLLPATTRKSFNLNVKDTVGDTIFDFCQEALLIPSGHLLNYEAAPNLDAYYITVRSLHRFLVSGVELADWEARKAHPQCTPGRDEVIYDQG